MKVLLNIFQVLIISTVTGAFSPSWSIKAIREGRSVANILCSSSQLSAVLSLELEKPLGLILEEVEEGAASGVKVEEVAESGSAFASPSKDQLIGMKIASVNSVDVSSLVFDDVMEYIINAPSPVSITFEGGNEEDTTPMLEIGTDVQIKVIQQGNEDKIIEAKVGDNLRKTLLDNNVELYRGLKKKLGNCGGGGQCTFCAVEFVDDEGSWQPRSDYENQKIPKLTSSRLACLNNIQGPATIRVE